MSKLKIYTFPEKVLAKIAKPVERVGKEYHKVADDMLETMYEAPGIGLAANQVGRLDRIIVVDVDYKSKEPIKDYPEGENLDHFLEGEKKNPIVMINPEIKTREGSIIFCEGCLSVPEYSAEVKRAEKIKVEYRDVDGLTKILSAEGLLAVCIQHEIDHLNGKLFIDRLSPLKKELAKKKLLRGDPQGD